MAFRVVAISLSAALLSGCMATGGTGYGMNYETSQQRQARLEAGLGESVACWKSRQAAYPEIFAKFDELIGKVSPGSPNVPLALRASTKPITDELRKLFLESTAQTERRDCRALELKAFNDYHPRYMTNRQQYHDKQDETVLKVIDGTFKTVGEYWTEVERNRIWGRDESARITTELNQQVRQDATLAAQQRAAQWQAYQAQQAEQRRQDDAMWAPYKNLLRPKASVRCTTLGNSTTCTEQ